VPCEETNKRRAPRCSCTWLSVISPVARLYKVTHPARHGRTRNSIQSLPCTLLLLFLVPSAPIDRFFKYSFPAMHFNYTSDLPVLFPLNINTIITPTHATLSLSSTMGGNNGSTRPQPSPAITTIAQALEFARDSPEGAQDPTVATILETALADIWRKIEAQPTSYVMTRDEFAVFNYFQDRFAGQQLATAARRRYWDHLQLQNGS
jgi:hypothetical protein